MLQKAAVFIQFLLLSGILVLNSADAASVESIASSRQSDTEHVRPLRFGLLPYLSPDSLIKTWSPLVEYLEQRLKRPIVVVTAPDFSTYIQRAARGDYDLYHTAPHFAALAEKQHKYRRLAKLARELDGEIVVSADSAYEKIEDLKNKIFATPDRLAIITMLGEKSVIDHGLILNKTITMKYTPSHNSALLSVAEGEADVAIAVGGLYERMPVKVKNKLRLLIRTSKVPHMMFMANPDMPENEYQLLKRVLLEFTADGAGKKFFSETGYVDIKPITDADMKRLTPILPLLEKRIHQQ